MQTVETPATTPLTGSARERLLAAATELFYAEGIHTVGIDRVIERAGVAKASLYNTFGSKDELIRAYLQERHARSEARLTAAMAAVDSPREKVLAIFTAQESYFERWNYRGCAFLNASAESAPDSAAVQATNEYRMWLRSVFRGLAVDGGASDPDQLAVRLQLIYDGAAQSARMERAADVFGEARALAGLAFDSATS